MRVLPVFLAVCVVEKGRDGPVYVYYTYDAGPSIERVCVHIL